MDSILTEKYSRDAYEVEEAIFFLVTCMLESGHNPKPVILHSIHMGGNLYNYNYELDIVKAAILHDIIEDSDISITEIVERFGEKVAEIVQTVTFDATVGDRAAQGKECIQRCLKYGRETLIVAVADNIENSYYFSPTLPEDFARFWIAEMRYLVNVSQPVIGSEPVWQELNQQCQKLEAALK